MRKIVVAIIVASAWLAGDAASASAQILYGPVGYTCYRGYGLGYNGPQSYYRGFFYSNYHVSYPTYGPIAVGPWGAFGGVGVVSPWGINPWAPPVFVGPHVFIAPPPVVVVGANGPWNPPAGAVRPPDPVPVAYAAPAKVDAAVRRGDLLVVRPNGEGIKPGFAFQPPVKPEAPVEKPPAGFAREVPPMPAAPPPLDPKARTAFEVGKAKEAFTGGEYGRAAERLAEAIKAVPNEALPYFLLAQACVARGEYAAAVGAIKEGFRRDPDWPAAPFKLKEVYGANAPAFDEHLKDLAKATAADGNDPTLAFLLGYHEWFQGRTAEAVRLFKKATKQVKDNGVIERFLLEAEGKKF